jgi:fucose permease
LKIPAKLKQTTGYFYAFVILGAVISALGPTINGLASNLGRTATALSFLFSFRAVGYLTGSLGGGYLYEKIRGNRALGFVLLLLAATLVLTPYLQTSIPLIFALILTGISCGATDVGSNTLLAYTHKKQVGPYLNAMYLFAGLGSFTAPLFLGSVSLEWGYAGLSLFILPASALLLNTPSPPIQKNPENQTESKLQRDLLFVFAFLSFFYIGMEVSFSGWIYTFFLKRFPENPESGYLITSLFWAGITAGRLLAIPLSTRVRETNLIRAFIGGGICSLTAMLLFPAEIWSVWVGTVGMGLSLSAIFPTTFSFVQKTHPFSPRQNGVVWASGSTGSIVLPFLIGRQIGISGPMSMPLILTVCWIFTLILLSYLLRSAKKINLQN